MHSPPRHRLDAVHVPVLTGCVEQARVISHVRPLLCVFGHYHLSWGAERVQWNVENDEVKEAVLLSKGPGVHEFDFSGSGPIDPLIHKQETLFVNAAWMTAKGGLVSERNLPFVIKLPLSG